MNYNGPDRRKYGGNGFKPQTPFEVFVAVTLEGLKKSNETTTKEIGSINNRCFERTEDFILMKNHLKEQDDIKSVWKDRNFKILLALVSPVYIALIGMLIGWIGRQ